MALTLDIEGPAAPPRLNGELVFGAPWEGRSFAMAMALVEKGLFTWDEFRDHLIAAVQRWEAEPSGEYRYYERWQEALESIVSELEIVAEPEVDELAATFAARPPGHDHGDHDHDHTHHDHGDHDDHDHRAHDHGDHDHGDHDHGAHDHGDHDHRAHDHSVHHPGSLGDQ